MDYRIGDKVRIINGIKSIKQPFGTVGTIVSFKCGNEYCEVLSNNLVHCYVKDELQLVDGKR